MYKTSGESRGFFHGISVRQHSDALCVKIYCAASASAVSSRAMEKERTGKSTCAPDFRLFLQQELVSRCQKNPNYSLRAFARALDVSSSALSGMLNGKRTITASSVEKLGRAIGLDPKEIGRYKILSREKKLGAGAELTSREEFQQITLDTYAIISDWYHYAILELINVRDFQPNVAWVSKSLGITKSEANIAVERLQRVGLLEITKIGKWLDKTSEGKATNIQGDLTSVASRKLQKQILELSLRSLEEIPSTELRNHTSLTLAINPEDIPLAKEKIKNFRRELAEMLESNRNPTEVYHVNVSLYPVTKISEGVKL